MLEAAGQDVHVYTSPHLVRFNERFRLAAEGGGQLVDDDELRATFEECERVNAGDPITVFEITTAAGLPHTLCKMLPAASACGLGTGMPRAAKWRMSCK